MKGFKLLNRIDGYSKSDRVIALIYRHEVLVERRKARPLTKDQYYRLTTLKNWYKMQELLKTAKENVEQAKYIAKCFKFKLETEQ